MSFQFEEVHRSWLERHLNMRQGDRRRRLEEGHAYLEKALLREVWWPAFGSLDGLHPEYEVRDFNDGQRYIDLAYKPAGIRLAIEADGFGPHVRDVGRWEHADNLLRDAHLIADGWTVVHFSSDVIRARQAQQLLRQIVWGAEGRMTGMKLLVQEREVIRYAKKVEGPVRPKEVGAYIGRNRTTTGKLLQKLARMGLLRPENPEAKNVRRAGAKRSKMERKSGGSGAERAQPLNN